MTDQEYQEYLILKQRKERMEEYQKKYYSKHKERLKAYSNNYYHTVIKKK